jgi:hypothetical protein
MSHSKLSRESSPKKLQITMCFGCRRTSSGGVRSAFNPLEPCTEYVKVLVGITTGDVPVGILEVESDAFKRAVLRNEKQYFPG